MSRFTVELVQDEDARNPREDYDHVGTMACWHVRYELGDVQPSKDVREYLLELAEEAVPGTAERWERFIDAQPYYSDIVRRGEQERGTELHWERTVGKVLENHYIMLPLYLYDHSGLTISTGAFSCPWDSGQVGFIYVSREKARKEYGWKRITPMRAEKAREYLRGEVEEYDAYLRGDVWGFVVKDQSGEELDSCWGFYGHEYAQEEGNVALAHLEATTPLQAELAV